MENVISSSLFLALAFKGVSLGLTVGLVSAGVSALVRIIRRSLQASFMIQ